jgi:ADP-ribosyl-[dinitrogen reductase] hydrolase
MARPVKTQGEKVQEPLIASTIAAGSARARARGALVGLAAGDAVGTTVEFEAPGSFPPLTDMVGGGPFHLLPGQWTDDTSLALCLAESILDRGGHDGIDQLRRYVRWWKEGYLSSTGQCFDIGTTTLTQLARFQRTGDAEDARVNDEEASNGSLMRLAPVAIRWSHESAEVIEQAAASSRTTHAAERPVDACRLLAAMTAALIRGESADSVFSGDFWQHGPLHPAVEAIARGSWRRKKPPEVRGTGYCIKALEAAVWAVAGARDFREAILRAANLGDDADTTAAIAGQLAGARFGETGIRAPWLSRLAMRTRIESLADGLHAAATGSALPWGFDATHHAWWIEPGTLLAGEYPGKRDPWEATIHLSMLADSGIDTIIDLTDEHDGLKPYDGTWARIAAERGRDLRRFHHPIRDVDVIDEAGYHAIVTDIERELGEARGVYVHCWGGVGRTGTVIGVWLRNRGLTALDALAAIRHARATTRKAERMSPETLAQVAAIRDFTPWRAGVVAPDREEA